jgi:hypothetical protein
MVFGFYGIVFEIINPGTLIPGTIGSISLLTGFYALSVLPVNIAGAALMLLGVALIVAEAFAPSFGVLGIGGAVALTLGATLLIDTDVPGFESRGRSSRRSASRASPSRSSSRASPRPRTGGKIATGREEMIGSGGGRSRMAREQSARCMSMASAGARAVTRPLAEGDRVEDRRPSTASSLEVVAAGRVPGAART